MKKIIILMMVLVVSVFAGNIEEIEKPYIPKGSGEIDSAVLAPDGETFYTLKGEIVTHWQLSPFKRLNSFILELDNKSKKDVSMYIASDGKKIVFNTLSSLILWDIKKKKVINMITYKNRNAVTDGQKLFTVKDNEKLFFDELNPQERIINDGLVIDIWDIETLKKINTINILDLKGMKYKDGIHIRGGQLLVGEKVLFYFISGGSNSFIMLIIDKTTHKLKHVYSQTHRFIKTIDYKLIVIDRQSPYKKNKFLFFEGVVDINTGEIVYTYPNEESSYVKKTAKYTAISIPEFYKIKTESFNKNLILRYRNKKYNYVFYDFASGERLASMYQFDSGEAVLINKKGYFEVTKNGKQYIKNKNGDITSISNATFQKYNKNLNIKGE